MQYCALEFQVKKTGYPVVPTSSSEEQLLLGESGVTKFDLCLICKQRSDE